jgi:hypothetical protein
MNRINGLVHLLFSYDPLKPPTVFGNSSGARADILRAIVVFLHATFEVALRSHIPKPSDRLRFCFYSRADLDKALKFSGIDATPFRVLYPPLTQMAKRRKRIVHEADLLHGEPDEWGFADDWQLFLWLMAVTAFYYQLRISLRAANTVERAMYGKLCTAMARYVAFGKQVIALPEVPPELGIQALQDMVVTLQSISSSLHLDPRVLITDSG